MSVSCSVTGDGPGTGGKGADGGSDKGGLVAGLGHGKGLGFKGSGEGGMWVGGAGKDERRSGMALCLSARRVSVVIAVAIAQRVCNGEGQSVNERSTLKTTGCGCIKRWQRKFDYPERVAGKICKTLDAWIRL